MIRLDGWIAVFSAMGLLWYECGEDLAVFCYRISCGAVQRFVQAPSISRLYKPS